MIHVGTCYSSSRVCVLALIHAHNEYRHHPADLRWPSGPYAEMTAVYARNVHTSCGSKWCSLHHSLGALLARQIQAGTHAPISMLIHFPLYYSTDSRQASNTGVRTHAVKRRTHSKTGVAISPVNTMIPGKVMCSSETLTHFSDKHKSRTAQYLLNSHPCIFIFSHKTHFRVWTKVDSVWETRFFPSEKRTLLARPETAYYRNAAQ